MSARILYVADESDNIDAFRPVLEEAGFKVSVANNYDAAMGRATTWHPNIIIYDVIPPDEKPASTLNQLKKAAGEGTQFIVVLGTHNIDMVDYMKFKQKGLALGSISAGPPSQMVLDLKTLLEG